MTEKEAYVAFNLTENIGSVRLSSLVARYGSVAAAWETYPDKRSRIGQGEVDWRREIAKANAIGVELVTPADTELYPKQLLSVPGHPLCLYVKGDAKALSRASVAIVGTRRATQYGLDQAYRFGRDLAAGGWAIVSGLALGIDAEAHRGALAAKGGIAIGVIGSGLNCFYPEANIPLAGEIIKHGGAVVSEFPFGRKPDQTTFPQRNHVVAALAKGIIAIEAPVKSGTLITASIAMELGRTVMAVPGRVDSQASSGCLKLIRDGAILVRSPGDVESDLGDFFPPSQKTTPDAAAKAEPAADNAGIRPQPVLSAEEMLFLKALRPEGVSIDEIIRETQLPAAKANALSMSLLMKGRVRMLQNGCVAPPRD